jgi:hypothetical protein
MPAVQLVDTEANSGSSQRQAKSVCVPFIDAETNKPVTVNASLVRCVRDHDAKGNTRIEFSRDHWVAVKSDVKSVSAKLFGA